MGPFSWQLDYLVNSKKVFGCGSLITVCATEQLIYDLDALELLFICDIRIYSVSE